MVLIKFILLRIFCVQEILKILENPFGTTFIYWKILSLCRRFLLTISGEKKIISG